MTADPLGLPAPAADLAQAATNPAVALLVDRARAVRADFHLSERNHRAVLDLVRLLQGLPLAHLCQPEAAIKLMAFAARYWETGFGPLSRGDRQTVRRVRGLVKAQLGAARAQALWDEGHGLNVAQAVALALQPTNPAS